MGIKKSIIPSNKIWNRREISHLNQRNSTHGFFGEYMNTWWPKNLGTHLNRCEVVMMPFSCTQWARVNFGILISLHPIRFHFLKVFFSFSLFVFLSFIFLGYQNLKLSTLDCQIYVKMIKEIRVKELSPLGSKSPVNNSWLKVSLIKLKTKQSHYFIAILSLVLVTNNFHVHGPFF